jgi:hypothetical protein
MNVDALINFGIVFSPIIIMALALLIKGEL